MLLLDLVHPALLEAIRRISSHENSTPHCAVRDYDGAELVVSVALPAASAEEGDEPAVDHAVAAVATVSLKHPAGLGGLDKHGNLAAVLKSVAHGFGAAGLGVACVLRDAPEPGAVATIDVTLGTPASDAALARASQLRVLCLTAPFLHLFAQFATNPAGVVPTRVPYRQGESLYLLQVKGIFLVVISVVCPDPEERLFVRNFLQGMFDVKKAEKSIAGAPGFEFSNGKAPNDLPAALAAEPESEATFWVTFGLGAKHMSGEKPGPAATVTQIVNFRSYLTYHIACARSQIHAEMRARVEASLQVLNRAKTTTTGKARVQIK